ncbi:hypothetical protein ACFS5J_12400 [Flavobacterium chuncheonense]|uniref:Uncharacterized protein n=1 Tax=Flavobacterium chuncheonense TaxID=2026653 RepID=A0ABW5YQ16_9FLAO
MEKHKFWIILITGFLTPILVYLFPVDGGGASIIFTISIPFFIFLSILFAFLYSKISKKIELKWRRNIFFSFILFIILSLTFYSFPCFDKDNLCPYEVVYNSVKTLVNYNKIKFDDILIEKKQSNYPLIVVAQKKYKKTFPNKIYYINYQGKETFTSEKFYAIYFRNGKVFSNNRNLKIVLLKDDTIQFSEIYNNEKIEFISTKSGFVYMPNEYTNYYNNGYEYINLEKEFKNFNLNIRKEPEKNITTEYGFYKILYWIS